MSTKSEHRSSADAIARVVNGEVSLSTADSGMINGFEENGVCEQQPRSHAAEQYPGGAASARGDLENGVGGGGELSPSALRRSTRACALKAAERIKLKESLTPIIDGLASHSGEGYVSGDDDLEEGKRPAKKRRYAAGLVLDQTNCKFGIKLEGDEVVLMSDESEVSSLNDVEVEHLKKAYEKMLHRDLSEEQKRERELLLKTMEADLRLEEAKLTMLKKLRLSQQVSVRQLQDANVRKMTANVVQNTSGNAYKPPIAAPPTRSSTTHNTHTKASTASTSSRAAANAAAALMNLTPQQQQVLQNAAKSGLLNSAAAQAILQQAQQHAHANGRMNQQAAALAAAAALSQQQSRINAIAQTTARESAIQKAAAAKLALRRQLEQQLLQIPPPRPPPPDMQFIPNGNQPDFCYLLGLDLAVQRILKDKNATRRVSEGPYICEECGTDYTPLWRAIGTDENSLHLYCEACVKAAQKKKMRQDHTALLRKAFNKVLEKEQELENQIAEGKYEASAPSSSTPRSATPVATPPPKHVTKTTPSTPGTSGTSAIGLKASASSSALLHQQNKSAAHKRPASNTASIASGSAATQNVAAAAAAAAIAVAAGGATSSNLLQQQMAAAAAFRHTNPMLAAMMANPLLNAPNMLQMQWNPLVQQRLPNLAMAALAQAVQNAQQSGGSAGSANAAAAANPLAALAATVNPAAAAALFSNPQMARQLQQVYQASQRNFLLEYAKSQVKK
uniref:Transcriptional repressor p66 coiled-coil MBD2-interaction domain-containing protein n=3 Tax=Parascaris univalens TaxID=6257 RepID=A0A915BS10_PARUN